ncbi:uncharacterized protein LOC133852365 [Alnus glutinosa]|nr:uncharacterized protein LOC133852365 [Alnus glutinosa]
MGLRPKLHPFTAANGKTYIPAACHTMSREDKENFLKVLRNVRVPDGYASNISRCVRLKDRTISGLKSHDSHILMQQLLPIALRKSLPDKVVRPLVEISAFFRGICSTKLSQEDMDRLQGDVCITLCKLEQIFPPGFFTSMVHLVVHLVRECRLGGPVQYRWMYPAERSLGNFKNNVRNKAAPEGCIAEGYIATELVTFCSRYLNNAPTFHNRPQRNPDGSKGAGTRVTMNRLIMHQIHRYIVFNSEEFHNLRTMHKDALRRSCTRGRITEALIEAQHHEQFCEWYRAYVDGLDDQRREELGHKLVMRCRGLKETAVKYNRYVVNGKLFRTLAHDVGRRTQNSGVCVPTVEGETYYGQLTDIFEVEYYDRTTYVLFKCNWADPTMDRGFTIDEYGLVFVNFNHLVHRGEQIQDEPYVLTSQVDQVFYVEDGRNPNWVCAVRTKPRNVYDVGQGDGSNEDGTTYHECVPLVLATADLPDTNDEFEYDRPDVDPIEAPVIQ